MAFKKEVVEIIEPRDVFVGNKKAEVTLEEFGDYESEACAKANEIVKRLLIEYKDLIRFNFRHFPLTNIHQRALKAGEAAVATAQDGKFWEMHNILFANRKNLGTTSLKLHSKEAGVNNKKFLDELVNATYGWQVQGDLKEGLDRGVKTVPAFFVNKVRVLKPTYEEIKREIEIALKKVKAKGGSKTAKAEKVKAEPVEETTAEVPAKAETAKNPVKPATKAAAPAAKKTAVKETAPAKKPTKKATAKA